MRVKSNNSVLKASEGKAIYSGQSNMVCTYSRRYFDFEIMALVGVQAGSLMS